VAYALRRSVKKKGDKLAKGNEAKALMALVVAAMVISFGGTYYLSQVMSQGGGISMLSGAATGTTTVSISGTSTDFDLETATIDFGTLARQATNYTNTSQPARGDGIRVINNGSVTMNFTINFTAELFTGESADSVNAFAFRCSDELDEYLCGLGGITPAWRDADPFEGVTYVAGEVPSTDATDAFFIDISVSVPSNEAASQKQVTITITGEDGS
jgi:hypothetical protein